MSVVNSLWVEKYRPAKIEDCVLTESVAGVVRGILKNQELPNLLCAGSAGVGKTTAAKALCRELGYDNIIINTSKERGIDTLRTTVAQFASSMSISSDMKVVILDEFDHATAEFQAAMRNFMEEFSATTRFILTCNYPQRIISPLHSRCAVLDFSIKAKDKPAIASQLMKRVCYILDTERVEYDKAVVAQIVAKFFPDFRRTINELQRYASINGKIDAGMIEASSGFEVNDLVSAIKKKDFKSARKWIVESLAIVDQNILFRKLYDQMYDLLEPSSIPSAILLIANYQHRGVTAVDPEINFSAFVIECMGDLSWK